MRPRFTRLEASMSDRLTLLRPDDWHIHLRDGAVLPHTVGDAARTFGRAIIMPNLVPPVRNAAEADAYRQRILAARPAGSRFEPCVRAAYIGLCLGVTVSAMLVLTTHLRTPGSASWKIFACRSLGSCE